jgi:iron complex transport system substrate-binding protein
LLGAAAGVCLAPHAKAAGRRYAVIDWAVLETVLALGRPPVAATELRQFREVAVEPIVPDGVVDLGLRGIINFEMLKQVGPDEIYSSNFYAASEASLSRIAPVRSFSVYVPGRSPYASAVAMTHALGECLDAMPAASAYLDDCEAEFASLRKALASSPDRSIIPINLGDPRHFRVFGADSMFGEALSRLGLVNAWTQATSYSAMAPIGLEALAQVPEAWIVLIPPTPPGTERVLAQSAFWQALPSVQAGRVARLPSMNPFGSLPTARRFARHLTTALLSSTPGGAP